MEFLKYLLVPDVLGKLIQALGAVMVAIVTKVAVPKIKIDSPLWWRNREWLSWAIAGATAAIAFAVMGLGINYFVIGKPTVSIREPQPNAEVEFRNISGGGMAFTVSGTSSKVVSNNDLRIIVLVHPANPYAKGWWLQPAAIFGGEEPDDWEAEVQLGTAGFLPDPGNQFDIWAIVVREEVIPDDGYVVAPEDLSPLARSEKLSITIP